MLAGRNYRLTTGRYERDWSMTHARIHRLVRSLADARQRMAMARLTGDTSGYEYARAEARRYARILAEG